MVKLDSVSGRAFATNCGQNIWNCCFYKLSKTDGYVWTDISKLNFSLPSQKIHAIEICFDLLCRKDKKVSRIKKKINFGIHVSDQFCYLNFRQILESVFHTWWTDFRTISLCVSDIPHICLFSTGKSFLPSKNANCNKTVVASKLR